ncbi:reverse transcriptase [Phytophthora megakarya]|uniref:Reverse transcriptase n=1 Tax=Phytophthora megakarya TaxID=4795 RepID=A0A225VMW0_9STRA|nr:reverse transcriptase [Phytophthora megakarya]
MSVPCHAKQGCVLRRLEQILREREPPRTQTQRYQWPTKLLMRPQSQAAEVKMVKLQEKPKPLDMTLKIIGNSAVVMNTARDSEESETRPEPVEQAHPDLSPDVETQDPEGMADVESNVQATESSVDVQSQVSRSTPVQRLEAEYARCNIDEANVGVPGVTTPEMEAKMRGILKRHRSIFLGDGNAAPAPARGVVCDIDVGEAKSVALRARKIAAPVLVKVFELLKKLLEAELIKHSESEWSSPIVIVLKKNGTDIRMCIDYRLLNLLI